MHGTSSRHNHTLRTVHSLQPCFATPTFVVSLNTVAMGCQVSQLILSPSVASTVLSQTTCRSTYGPRYLTSVPTTIRATSTNITVIEKPLQYSTACSQTFVPSTITTSNFVIVTETGIDIPTSTRIAYVSSTVYETVLETTRQTITAPEVTITPIPTILPTPAGFTPIGSNPANAGANTYSAFMVPPTTDVPIPGIRLLADGLQVRAEKSYSNVNRVICDETTSFITTSVRPFSVRHTMLTTTLTYWDGSFTTLTQDVVLTTTESQAYEDTTETLTTTETATLQAFETTTVTPTIELPQSTAYAACANPDNFISGIQGFGIMNLNVLAGRTGIDSDIVAASSPQSCCEACVGETTRVCSSSISFYDACFRILSNQCNGAQADMGFDVSRSFEPASHGSMIISNGVCGQEIFSGVIFN